jgi:hypothetical protein
MKSNKIFRKGIVAFAVTIAGVLSFSSSSAQCEKRDLCSDDWQEDYDFRSQSSFAKLSPGDTSSVSLVLYSNQKYRMFVCSDEELGGVMWKIVNPERKTKRSIQSIKKDTVVIYKTNEYGDFITDENGNTIVKSKTVMIDTLWATERITVDKVMYDSKKNSDKPYLDVIPKKTERYIIKITVPGADPNMSGCVNVYVGRIPVSSKSFNRSGNNRTNDTY